MKLILKDGSTTRDPRLARIEQFDERSKNYRITAQAGPEIRTRAWPCSRHLDQGSEGACVGFGISHGLIAQPVTRKLDASSAINLYYEAQKIDSIPGGSYPGAVPHADGTSVLAGMKAARAAGYVESYYWGFSLTDLLTGLSNHGPAVLGLRWFEGMRQPDENGYIHPTGRQVGGHCILCKALDVGRERVTLHNSWGPAWGVAGDCYLSFDELASLVGFRSDTCFFSQPKPGFFARFFRFLGIGR